MVQMHLAGFEPATSLWEADYESDAFGHLATDALKGLELVGLEPTSTFWKNLTSHKFSRENYKIFEIKVKNLVLIGK